VTAGRLYVVQSWNNASAFSGEQIGTRLAQSKGLHLNRDGTANLALYDDERWRQEKASKRQRTPEEILLPHEVIHESFNALEARIDAQFDNGEIGESVYSDLIHALYIKRAIAFKKHMQSIGQYEQWLDERIKEQSKAEEQPKAIEPGSPKQRLTPYETSNAELIGLYVFAAGLLILLII